MLKGKGDQGQGQILLSQRQSTSVFAFGKINSFYTTIFNFSSLITGNNLVTIIKKTGTSKQASEEEE